MSDLDISGSDSEPVSDIKPEEMDKLMADLGDFDDDIFKSTAKSTAKKQPSTRKEEDKDLEKRVTFDEKKATNLEEEDDWDADDLLQSDDEKPQKQLPKSKSPGKKLSDSPAKKGNEEEEKHNQRSTAKSKLMADLFPEDGKDSAEEIPKTKSGVASGKKDKSKLMAELFGNEGSELDKSPLQAGGGERKASGDSRPKQLSKKAKDDVTFDDDDDDLLGGFGDSKRTKSVSPKGSSFLDSLLTKSGASEKPKERKKSTEFILDDKYKNMGKDRKEEKDSFGGYMPSVGKSDSPRRRTPKKSPVKDPLDIFGDSEPRRRNPGSATRNKTFEVDDDDILSNVRSRRTPSKDQGEAMLETKNKRKDNSGTPARHLEPDGQIKSAREGKDDWLFDSSGGETNTMNKGETNSVNKNKEGKESEKKKQPSAERPSPSPDQGQNWLGSLLSGDKKSPVISNKVSTSNSPTVMPSLSPHQNKAVKQPSDRQSSESPNIQQSVADKSMGFLKQQHETQAQMQAAQFRAQQQQIESEMALQIQQQQQNMSDVVAQQQAMMKRYQEAISNMSQMTLPAISTTGMDTSKDNEKQMELQVDLQCAKTEVARLQAELDLIRKQHAEEISLLEEAQARKVNVEREVWEQIEQRLRQERDGAVVELQSKLSNLQVEKENLASSYEAQLENVKREWSQALERTKELYQGIMDRMKEEHKAGLQRMNDLKDLELKAAMSASGHVREVEVVMSQLENNASNLSEITAIVNSKHDKALELTQRALQIKEKQLQDFEAQLAASRTESENERGRLNALIHRLENTLIQQGSEVEKDRWKLAQERMKLEIERQAMTEERRHIQLTLESERQNLSSARESLLKEHRSLLQNVTQQKQELESQQSQLNAQQRYHQMYSLHNIAESGSLMNAETEAVITQQEQRRLKEKMTSLDHFEQEVRKEKENLEQISGQLEQEKIKLALEREAIQQEQQVLTRRGKEIESTRHEVQTLVQGQQARLSQITAQTASLQANLERIEKEKKRLEQLKEEVAHSIQLGLCPACQSKGGITLAMDRFSRSSTTGRLPADGGEGHVIIRTERNNSGSLAPASVLARLAAARELENQEREKKLMQISAMESS